MTTTEETMGAGTPSSGATPITEVVVEGKTVQVTPTMSSLDAVTEASEKVAGK